MGADGAAVQERHAERRPAPTLLRQGQQPLPYAEVKPTVEALRGHPPRAEFGRNGPPLGPVAVAPDDCLDRPSQIVRLGLAARPNCLDQRGERVPLGVAQNPMRLLVLHPSNIRTSLKP